MRKLLIAFGSLLLGTSVYAGQGASNALKVSSGTFLNVQGFGNSSGNFLQGIAVTDSSNTVTAPVDPVQGLAVYLGTSSLTTSTAVKVDGSGVTQPVSGTFFQVTQPISGTVAATQSGAWNLTNSTVGVTGTVAATQSGAWNLTNSTVGISGTVPISGNVGQSGTYTVTPGTGIFVTSQSGTYTTTPGTGTQTISGNVGQSGTYTTTPGTGTWTVGTHGVTGVGTFAVTPSSGNYPVLQIGTRWATAFSTTTTTAVLSSTAVTTNVAISTPIAGLSSQTVRIFSLILSVDSATNINFRDGSTNFGDTYYLYANGSLILDFTSEPWYITSASNGFVIKQSGTANVSIQIRYTQS